MTIVERKRLVALGDSITFGWPYGHEASWLEIIKENGPFLDVINKGISGDTFGDMLNRLEEDLISYRPDYCIIMGGTNEAYLHVSQVILKNNLQKILEKVSEIECKIIVGIPVPVEDIAMERYLKDIRKWLRAYCQAHKYEIIDFYSAMLDKNKENINSDLFLDGCHPNKAGYNRMGLVALERLKECKLLG